MNRCMGGGTDAHSDVVTNTKTDVNIDRWMNDRINASGTVDRLID